MWFMHTAVSRQIIFRILLQASFGLENAASMETRVEFQNSFVMLLGTFEPRSALEHSPSAHQWPSEDPARGKIWQTNSSRPVHPEACTLYPVRLCGGFHVENLKKSSYF